MILLESYPCSACDEMRLGHVRFPHESLQRNPRLGWGLVALRNRDLPIV
jgi:hypothetical protein